MAVLVAAGLLASSRGPAQDGKGPGKGKQPDFIPADYDDYQNMLDQLGIKKMRKGRDGERQGHLRRGDREPLQGDACRT